MRATELRYRVESAGHDPHFFTRETMRFFGDTMSNYRVRSKPVQVETLSGPVLCWELYRAKPVKHGLQSSAFFNIVTYAREFALKG